MEPSLRGEASSDRAIVERVLAGDTEAYASIVHRYREKYGRYSVSMCGDSDGAADAMQEAFIKAYESLDRCRNPDRFGSWFFRILSNACRDQLRGRPRRHLTLEGRDLASDETVDGQFIKQEDLARMKRAVADLNENQRQAFSLKHVTGLSYEEMSGLLDEPVDSLKMRVYRARTALRKALKE